MAAIVVRDLEDDVKERIKARAAEKGVSMEAEVRAILTESVAPRSLLDLTRECMGSDWEGIDIELPSRADRDDPVLD